jgi:hypothetical protein
MNFSTPYYEDGDVHNDEGGDGRKYWTIFVYSIISFSTIISSPHPYIIKMKLNIRIDMEEDMRMRLNIKIRMNMEEDMRVRLKIRMKMEEDIGKIWLIIFKLDGFKLDINRFLLKNVDKNPIA